MKRPTLAAGSEEPVVLCCISPPFGGLSTTQGQITYVLLTRAPLYRGRSPFSCDLHVLGAPLTFVLSQDQTLQLNPVGQRPVCTGTPPISFHVDIRSGSPLPGKGKTADRVGDPRCFSQVR